ncbi:DUF6234 family protein [Streptomyces clavifer]|uniref:DUF6234 family protein n=1 Tax=Streptomyces clavifer TaxID=68188 RepID=UPI003690A6D1
MTTEPASDPPRLPGVVHERARDTATEGGGFEGGCLTVIAVLIEIAFAAFMALSLGMRGWAGSTSRSGSTPGDTGPPPMDWVPVLWLGGFTLGVSLVAVFFLRSGHPLAGTFQLLIGAALLAATVAAGLDEHERAHPAPLPACPTQAGVPCTPKDPDSRPPNGQGSTGHQCRSGGDSDECADSGR